MKRFNTIILQLMIIALLASPCFAGENPFSGVVKAPLKMGHTPSIDPSLPPLVEGKEEAGTVEVSTTLNIRSSPWGDIIGSFSSGDKLTIVGQTGDWYKIKHNGKTAYVHSAYVKRQNEGAKPFARKGWVNAPIGLNVRRVPHGDVVGKLSDQRAIEIIGVAGGYYKIKWGDNNEAFVDRRYVDTDMPASPADKVEPANFTGYVTASRLNVRMSPWGGIKTTITSGTPVKVTGKVDDWYRIEINGRERYVHQNYISKSSSDAAPPAQATPSSLSGSEQQRIVQAAKALVGSTRFRGPEVKYGRLACAQVVSTALKNAGALSRVHLGVLSTLSDLRSKGWREVSAPPYQEGDVITWKTYDRNGNGRKDPDTHIGIIVKQGNTFKAMHNSSRLRTPRLTAPNFGSPVSRVLRKVS